MNERLLLGLGQPVPLARCCTLGGCCNEGEVLGGRVSAGRSAVLSDIVIANLAEVVAPLGLHAAHLLSEGYQEIVALRRGPNFS